MNDVKMIPDLNEVAGRKTEQRAEDMVNSLDWWDAQTDPQAAMDAVWPPI